ncbi:MAG: pseudouridine-5'-phosphate glycosidase [Acidimicrobiia bacterium]|nr:pseudouridine-5'-phosphate glycosidase [Acidimicrobiia bacterium]
MSNDPGRAHPSIELTDEVDQALRDGTPVVALESTIISHGMPYPQNVEMATSVEGLIRSEGAVPATIAIFDGVPKVGLSEADLELLATSPEVQKMSLRDIPYVISRRLHGATTVASTLRFASLVGITTFVTGGIGGVHRGAQQSFDISADLTEMSLTDVAVVSAGVKSILDIGLTLETMETLSIPVITYQSDEFPSFYSRSSGFDTPMRLDTPAEVAALMRAKWDLGLRGGVCIANPVPEADEFPADEISSIIEGAVAELDAKGISGKDATPFMLGRIAEITGGKSLTANIALVENNAVLGARVAKEYARLA